MSNNPIRKFTPGQVYGHYEGNVRVIDRVVAPNLDGPRKGRRWGYECPMCHERGGISNYYSGRKDSRKCAKDALHQHMKEVHGGPGLGV